MLNADTPVPAVVAHRAATYGRIFEALLSRAAHRLTSTSKHHPNITITSTDFDVVQNHYPASLCCFDAIVISGSASSAYDNEPWIARLAAWIREAYQTHPRIPIFGSCFGHQIVCHALLAEYGVRVEQDAKGWELGVQAVRLDEGFCRRFGGGRAGDEDAVLRLQFVHHDHVVLAEGGLPAGWMLVGSTPHCSVQGVYEPGRVLTLQGHFEFDAFVNGETVKFFFPHWEPEVLGAALRAIDAEDDAEAAAELVLRFFLDEQGGKTGADTFVVEGGLLTPPVEE